MSVLGRLCRFTAKLVRPIPSSDLEPRRIRYFLNVLVPLPHIFYLFRRRVTNYDVDVISTYQKKKKIAESKKKIKDSYSITGITTHSLIAERNKPINLSGGQVVSFVWELMIFTKLIPMTLTTHHKTRIEKKERKKKEIAVYSENKYNPPRTTQTQPTRFLFFPH